MAKRKYEGLDMTGEKRNSLTIISKAYYNSDKVGSPAMVLVQCDCGKKIEVEYGRVITTSGAKQSCGCSMGNSKRKFYGKDFTGKRHQKFTIISPFWYIKKTNRQVPMVKVECDCGKKLDIEYRKIIKKYKPKQSCGCGLKHVRRKYEQLDLIGKIFGKLTIVNKVFYKEERQRFVPYVKAKCDCGNTVEVSFNKIKNNNTLSCGCMAGNPTHEGARNKERLYVKWCGMKARCYSKGSSRYKNYGGRGIVVCDEWKNDYAAFRKWALGNGYVEGLSIDRIDVNGNYKPSNCRWITMDEQARNKTNSVSIEIDGSFKSLKGWQDVSGVHYATISDRYKKGIRGKQLLESPRKNRSFKVRCLNDNILHESASIAERHYKFSKGSIYKALSRHKGLHKKSGLTFKRIG